MAENSGSSGAIIGAIIAGVASIIGAVILANPGLVKFDKDSNDSEPVVPKEEQVTTPQDKLSENPEKSDSIVVRDKADKIPVRKLKVDDNESHKHITNFESDGEKNLITDIESQPVTPVLQKANSKVDVSGIWKFDVDIVRGKDATGTLFDFHNSYQPIVEIIQLGSEISGTYSGPPAVMCGSGSIAGSLSQDTGTTKIQWILDCNNECKGEKRKFSGTYDNKTRVITGRFQPANTPSKKGCWLAFENLSGKPDF